MIIYNDTIIAFNQKATGLLKQILIEWGFKVLRSRFECRGRLYPLEVVCFEGSELAYYDHHHFQIALNKKLLYQAKDQVLKEILKHELIHYLVSLYHPGAQAHGREFREFCEKFHVDFNRAEIKLFEENDKREGDIEVERLLLKVKKLLELSQSENPHEAKLATIKANQLLLRHHLTYREVSPQLYLKRFLERPRKDAKLVAIYDMLKFFMVRVVLNHTPTQCSLEVSGTKMNLELAEYVIHFLDQELDRYWELEKKKHQLQGLRAKNSFFLGIAQGYELQMKEMEKEFSLSDQKSLRVIKEDLHAQTNKIYKRLSHSSTKQEFDHEARELGIERGKKLKMRQGVQSQNSSLLIGWNK